MRSNWKFFTGSKFRNHQAHAHTLRYWGVEIREYLLIEMEHNHLTVKQVYLGVGVGLQSKEVAYLLLTQEG